jgi:hypothetical protein
MPRIDGQQGGLRRAQAESVPDVATRVSTERVHGIDSRLGRRQRGCRDGVRLSAMRIASAPLARTCFYRIDAFRRALALVTGRPCFIRKSCPDS